MTTTVEDLLADAPDPLIKNGRYQIVPDGEKKAKAYTRVTNFAKKIEDTFSLTRWQQRMVLLGAAHRPDIVVAALAAGDDREALNGLAEDAMEAAKANVARELGTALHRLCERVDAGEVVTLPEPWSTDIAVYTHALRQLGATVELIEAVVVYPRLKLAGRLDRTVVIDGERYILDLKTGADLSYSWGSIAIQLALYAGAATIYDPDTKQHTAMPRCNQERAIVIHLPAGEGKATPYWINLEAGRHGIWIVEHVLEWRRGVRHVATTEPISHVAREDVRAYVAARIRNIIDSGYGAELAQAWPANTPTLKASGTHSEAQLDLILVSCSLVEARHEMPFPHLTDPRQWRPTSKKGNK